MQRLLLLGLNHTTAPLAVRERLAFSGEQQRAALARFRAAFPACEAVLLSTCNRVELYTARTEQGHPRPEELAQFVGDCHGVSSADFNGHLYEKSQHAVVDHLFRVAASLDSMVLGETQILGQVRSAYDAAVEMGSAGAILNPLFQRAIAAGKQVMTSTGLPEGRVSVASVAVDFATRIFETFTDKTLMTVGAGKMTQLVLRHFSTLRPKRTLLCNRDASRAQALAQQYGGEAIDIAALDHHLHEADILITSTGSPLPILTRKQFELAGRQRKFRPVFVIDLAVPRDVDSEVGKLEHVYLYDMDDLQSAAASAQSQRHEAIEAATLIVQRHVEQFLAWHRSRELGPAIEALYTRYHQLADEELQRTIGKLGNVSPSEIEHLRELSRRIVNKLLHDPVQTLRRGDALYAPTPQYLHAMDKLFKLELPPEQGK